MNFQRQNYQSQAPEFFSSVWNGEQPVPRGEWGWELFTQFHVTNNLNLRYSVNVLISKEHYIYIKTALVKITKKIFPVFYKLSIHLITENYKQLQNDISN